MFFIIWIFVKFIFTGTSERIWGVKRHILSCHLNTQKDRATEAAKSHHRARNNGPDCDVWRRWAWSRDERERVWLVLHEANVSQGSIRDDCWESSQHWQPRTHTFPYGIFDRECLLLAILPSILKEEHNLSHLHKYEHCTMTEVKRLLITESILCHIMPSWTRLHIDAFS